MPKDSINTLLENITKVLSDVDEDEIDNMIERIILTKVKGGNVFVVGAGRSGLVAKSFAMRLYAVGFSVVVVGETIVPKAREKDCIIAISGSGTTQFTVNAAEAAKQQGAKVIAITSRPESPLGQLADELVELKGRIEDADSALDYAPRQLSGLHTPLHPLGSLFELSAMILLEAIISEILSKVGISPQSI